MFEKSKLIRQSRQTGAMDSKGNGRTDEESFKSGINLCLADKVSLVGTVASAPPKGFSSFDLDTIFPNLTSSCSNNNNKKKKQSPPNERTNQNTAVQKK
jgi:hypothetical protein